VKSKFPRLAYITSDVIIRVGCQDLMNFNWVREYLEHWSSVTNNGKDEHRFPTLILIRNKVHSIQVKSIAEATRVWRTYMERFPEYAVLGAHFPNIYIVHLPYWDAPEFDSQIQDLKNLLVRIAQEKMAKKDLLEKPFWLELYRSVLDEVAKDKMINLKPHFFDLLKVGNVSIDTTMHSFLRTYKQEKLLLDYFVSGRKFAVEMFARNLAQELTYRHQSSPALLCGSDWLREYGEKLLQQLWKRLGEYEPCCARKQNIFCLQPKSSHLPKTHITREPVSIAMNLFPSHQKWDTEGGFQSSDNEQSYNTIKDTFVEHFQQYLEGYKRDQNQYQYTSFKKIWFGIQFNKTTMYPGICYCCLQPLKKVLKAPFSPKERESDSGFVDAECFKILNALPNE